MLGLPTDLTDSIRKLPGFQVELMEELRSINANLRTLIEIQQEK